MAKVNVSATVGICDSGGNVCDSGEIEYALRNLKLEIVIHNFISTTSEDTLNNMLKAHQDLKK